MPLFCFASAVGYVLKYISSLLRQSKLNLGSDMELKLANIDNILNTTSNDNKLNFSRWIVAVANKTNLAVWLKDKTFSQFSFVSVNCQAQVQVHII